MRKYADYAASSIGHSVTDTAGGYATGKKYISIYNVNMDAGSFWWYHSYSPRQGFYPVRRWRSSPSKVGYLFETGEHTADSRHIGQTYTRYDNAWRTGWYGTYGPGAPHMGGVKSNIMYADGHVGNVDKDSYTDNPYNNVFPDGGEAIFRWY